MDGEYDDDQSENLDNSSIGEYDKSDSVQCDVLDMVGGRDQSFPLDGYENIEQWNPKNGRPVTLCQLDGNDTIDSISNYDSEEELECEPIRAVLVPAPRVAGQPVSLEVDSSEEIAAPSSLPLTMVANFRSAYNKIKNIKRNLYVLGLDLMIASESWERPNFDLNQLLDSQNYVACRHAGKLYPGKTGGGAAIIYNRLRFEASDTDISVPLGVEIKWCVFVPLQKDD